MKLTQLAHWVLLLATPIIAATNAAQHVTDIKGLHQAMEDGFSSLGSYGGSVSETMELAKAAYRIRSASITARTGLKNAETLSDEDAESVIDSFEAFQFQAVSTLRSAREKMPVFTIPGAAYGARLVLQHIHEEKKAFIETMMEKMPDGPSDRIGPLSEEIDRHFGECIGAFGG